ncbi:MAG: 50S ribosomal protein L31e [Candidatus Lokiarchaeota archaeon]|nr:50S ribosomal protein L31e [Candidatus Lokiarchaeota archaeon]
MAKKKSTSKKSESPEVETDELETSEQIDSLSIDDVAQELSAFEEEPSEVEREISAAEEEFEEEIQEERIYTIPLAREFQKAPNWNRTKRAMKVLRKFVTRHMKPEALYISQEVNELLWENGIKKPPRKIRVRVTKSVEGLVRVFPA